MKSNIELYKTNQSCAQLWIYFYLKNCPVPLSRLNDAKDDGLLPSEILVSEKRHHICQGWF